MPKVKRVRFAAASRQQREKIIYNNSRVDKLEIFNKPRSDSSIVKEDFITFLPFTLNANKSDTIRIEIQSSDSTVSLYDSFIKINGTYEPVTAGKVFKVTNNAALFLFDEIQLILGTNHIIDVCRQPGITRAIKGIASYSNEDRALDCTSWKFPLGAEVNIGNSFKDGRFSCCIPLSHVLGFAEDYAKVIMNMRAELVLIRSKNDFDCFTSVDGDNGTDVNFTISKLSWEVPHITLGDEEKLNLMNSLKMGPPIVMPFRQWELHELPALNNAKSQVWRIKNSNEMEKPRWILLAIQDGNKGQRTGNSTKFTHSNLVDIKAHLNSQTFPYQRMNLDFAQNDYLQAYLNYKKFRESYYYGREAADKCLLSYESFKEHPIFVIDCTRQQESLKDSTVDIRLEIESANNFSATTRAYSLILHDAVVEYDPFTENVNRYVRTHG